MISINSSTRQFIVPGADLVFGVEDDSGSERKHFQCPRFVGNNLDIASSFVRINYRNANGEIDAYLVDDLAVEGDNVTFSWLLTPKVTMYKGQIKFVMCVVGPDTKIKWHTTQGTGQVLEGLEPEAAVESETADVIAQLITMVEAQTEAVEKTGSEQVAVVKAAATTATAGAVTEIEAKRVNSLESIPADYTALGKAVDVLTKGRAGAIICETEGTVVVANDASNMPMQGLRIFGRSVQDGIPTLDAPVEIVSAENPMLVVGGKNLIPNLSEYNGHGITITPNPNGSTTVNGKATNSLGYRGKSVFLPAGTYTLKCNHVLGDGTWLSISNGSLMIFPGEQKCTYELESGEHWLYFYINSGVELNNLVLDVQLEPGDVATAYEPHKPIQTIETTRPLHGIPLITSSIVTAKPNYIDSDGKRWVCDEVDLERGVYVQRVKKYIMDGTRPVVMLSATAEKTRFNVDWIVGVPGGGVMCDSLVWDVSQQVGTVQVHGDTGKLVLFVDKATNVADFQAYLAEHPITVLIQTTPVEIPLSETEIAAYRALHSNKPNTTIINSSGAHMSVAYAADTKLYIDNKIAALVGG